jgi:pimeloyl-ACP methyl ester carboxylesterase
MLGGLRAAPWRTDEVEAGALKAGFAQSTGFWRLLWWGILLDVPTGLRHIDCPVVLAQGVADVIAAGQTVRYRPLIAGSHFVPLYHQVLPGRVRAAVRGGNPRCDPSACG